MQAAVRARCLARTWEAFWRIEVEELATNEVAKRLGIDYMLAYRYHDRVLKALRVEAERRRKSGPGPS